MSSGTLPIAHGLLTATIDVLLVEDDDGDALLVVELLDDAFGDAVDVIRARSLAEAMEQLRRRPPSRPSCTVVDLGLPDAQGLEVVHSVRTFWPSEPLVVFTGLDDESRGLDAVSAGAQDFLVKGRVEPQDLRRAVLYAVERCRADVSALRLLKEQLDHAENLRLERGLLPSPILDLHEGLTFAARYRPGSNSRRLGGDFYDLVENDGIVHLLIGDVCGHGPDEAALGVVMRVAWRALVRAGLDPAAVTERLDDLMALEAVLPAQFTTMGMIRFIGPNRIGIVLAGHPPPFLLTDGEVAPLPVEAGPPLGLGMKGWTEHKVEVPDGSSVLAFTDGLIEGRVDPNASERMGMTRVAALIEAHLRDGDDPDEILDQLMEEVEERNGGTIEDDIALLHVEVPRLGVPGS